MFSGLIESVKKIEEIIWGEQSLSLWIGRPAEFKDIKIGDSIAVDGVCLTLEELTEAQMKFTLGAESLKILFLMKDPASLEKKLIGKSVNLERSLKWGDRVHGHLVSGHVEALGTVVQSRPLGDSWILEVSCPSELKAFILKKGSIALHGVSLTVNEFTNSTVQVCLIPETIRKTNLAALRPGDQIHIETDLNIKSLVKILENEDLIQKISAHLKNPVAGGSHEVTT